MPLSATLAEVTDVPSAVDMVMDTEMLSLESMDILLRLDSVLATTTSTSVTSQDPHITDMDTESEDATPRDGPMDMETDTVLDTDTDTVSPTDGLSTMDMDTETQAPRDP